MKVVTQKTQDFVDRLAGLGGRLFILLAASVLLGSVVISQVHAQTAQSNYHSDQAVEFCKTITPTAKKNACQDGWDNKQECSNYQELNFDPSIAASDLVKSCEAAKEASAVCKTKDKLSNGTTCPKGSKESSTDSEGECSTSTTTKTPSSTTTTTTTSKANSSGNCDSSELQSNIDKLCKEVDAKTASEEVKNICKNKAGDKDTSKDSEEVKELKKAVEALKKAAEPPLPDNQYGKYVNGANKYQALRVNRAEGDNRPVIIFFNGGGWVSDDGVGDKIAPQANARGYTTIVATYRLGGSGIYYQLDDVMRAIQHVRNNAGMYGIDPSRIAIWGDSAGGSLTMRAAATGKSGARVAVGWSAPTNAYTAIFHSARAFAVGMSHSTCAPTDLAGINDTLKELNGDKATSTDADHSSEGGSSPTAIVQNVLKIATQAQEAGETVEAISQKLENEEGQEELSGNVRRLATKKIIECMDNFNTGSPALFASPQSPPAFLAGYDNDPLVHPGQAFQMRDKLRALGIPSEALILPGAPISDLDRGIGNDNGSGENHLGYHEKFVSVSLDFVDKFLHPNSNTQDQAAAASTQDTSGQQQQVAQAAATAASAASNAASGGSSGSSNSGQSSGPLCGIDDNGTWNAQTNTCTYPVEATPSKTPSCGPGETLQVRYTTGQKVCSAGDVNSTSSREYQDATTSGSGSSCPTGWHYEYISGTGANTKARCWRER